MRFRSVGVAAVAALLALVTACGSDGGSSESSATPTTQLTGAPIVVGAVCSCSGPQASVLGPLEDVGKAWESHVNSNGGINGHPVKLIIKDDGSNPADSLRAVKELVEQDKVLAIVGDGSLADNSWADYVAQKGVPVVGGLGVNANFLANPNYYPVGGLGPVTAYGATLIAKEAGKKKLGLLYCAESPQCAQFDPLAGGIAKLVGVGYYSEKVSATAPDYTATCLALKNNDVDALEIANNSSVVLRIVDSCAKLNYKPLIVTQAAAVGKDWPADPNMDGSLAAASNAPYFDDSLPAIKQFHEAVDKQSPDLRDSDQFGDNSLMPWTSGKLFEAAAKAVNLSPTSTSADVVKGLLSLKGETLDGLAPPLTFAAGKPTLPKCYFVLGVKDDELSAPQGTDAKCLSDDQFTGLTTMLAAAAG